MSAYTTLKDAIEEIIPSSWYLVDYEQPVGSKMPDATQVEMKLRTVSRLSAAPGGAYQVEWVITITTQYTSRETADPSLYDDLIDFLYALDTNDGLSWLGWTEASKTVGDDLDRLAYDITVRTHTSKEGA